MPHHMNHKKQTEIIENNKQTRLIMKRLMIFAIVAISALTMIADDQKKQPKGQKLSPEERKAQMLNARVKTMKEKLLLTAEQTDKFIPIYQEYMDEMGKQFGKGKAKKAEVRTIEDAQKQVIEGLDAKAKVIEVQKQFIPRFAKVLTPQQLVKFLPVESEMQRMVRKERMQRSKDSLRIKKKARNEQISRAKGIAPRE